MKKHELQTPAILLDLDKLEHNIQSWQALCNENGKELWPMIKTHKSTALARLDMHSFGNGPGFAFVFNYPADADRTCELFHILSPYLQCLNVEMISRLFEILIKNLI